MQATAVALAFVALLSILGVLGLVFVPGDSGLFVMVAGAALFGVFAALAATMLFAGDDNGF